MWHYRAAAFVALLCTVIGIKRFVYVPTYVYGVSSCDSYGWDRAFVKRRVWDAVPFNSELDILYARLIELDGVVTGTVVVESPEAFSGKKKPLHFFENRDRFARFPVTHVVANVTVPSSMKTEKQRAIYRKNEQKNWLRRGLVKAGALPDDLVIVSDVDEIPRRVVIEQLQQCRGFVTPVELHTIPYIYDFGCKEVGSLFKKSWRRAKVLTMREFEEVCDGSWDGKFCVDELRDSQRLMYSHMFSWPASIQNAGVHISYFMSTDKIMEKIASYGHIERNIPRINNRDHIECYISRCKHVNDKDFGVRAEADVQHLPWLFNEAYHFNNEIYKAYFDRELDLDACYRDT